VRVLKILIALSMIALMAAFAKVAQYASVDAFGDQLGFDGASLLGVGPVIALYCYLAVQFSRSNKFGLNRG